MRADGATPARRISLARTHDDVLATFGHRSAPARRNYYAAISEMPDNVFVVDFRFAVVFMDYSA
jgi:hypothetical protein